MKHRRLWHSLPPPAKRRPGRAPPPPSPKRRRCLAPPPADFRCGKLELVLLLFETPSGFAIFSFCSALIDEPNAMEVTWTYFAETWSSCSVVWLNEFRTFEDKSSAIDQNTGVNERLVEMIRKWHCPGQKMAVGKPEYKKVIEERLKIPCLCGPTVMELMWGIQKFMPSSVPGEKSQLTEEDRLPISKGLQNFLSCYDCNVKPELVNEKIIATAGALFRCDSTEKRHSKALRSAGDLIKDVSGINCEHWTLLKIATALKMIWWPEEAGDSCVMISKDEVSKLVKDAKLYEIVLNKASCLRTYNHMVYAHKVRTQKKAILNLLLEKAKESEEAEQKKKAEEAEQAKAASEE